MGITNAEMPVFDPYNSDLGGNSDEAIRNSRVILWKGHCSVHNRFTPEMVDRRRAQIPGVKVIVHPECRFEVAQKSDAIGLTVPGMPVGSPGMEQDGKTEPYDVLLIKKDGATEVFARH